MMSFTYWLRRTETSFLYMHYLRSVCNIEHPPPLHYSTLNLYCVIHYFSAAQQEAISYIKWLFPVAPTIGVTLCSHNKAHNALHVYGLLSRYYYCMLFDRRTLIINYWPSCNGTIITHQSHHAVCALLIQSIKAKLITMSMIILQQLTIYLVNNDYAIHQSCIHLIKANLITLGCQKVTNIDLKSCDYVQKMAVLLAVPLTVL